VGNGKEEGRVREEVKGVGGDCTIRWVGGKQDSL